MDRIDHTYMKIVIDTEHIESMVAWAAASSVVLALVLFAAYRYFRDRTISGMFDRIRETA